MNLCGPFSRKGWPSDPRRMKEMNSDDWVAERRYHRGNGVRLGLDQYSFGCFFSINHCLEPQKTSSNWMFGEATISYVNIWNHPIEPTIYICYGCLGFQIGNRSDFYPSIKNWVGIGGMPISHMMLRCEKRVSLNV